MTAAEHVVAHFDRISEAPDAITRLRRFVLELAVRGKLVEPVSRWPEATLGELGAWGSGGTPAKAQRDYYGGDIPWLVIGDLNESVVTTAQTHISEAGLANSSARLVEPGTVLIALYGSIGKLGIAGIRCATNQAIAFCAHDDGKVTRDFLVVLLRSMREALLAKGQGGAQQNISQKILKAHRVALPSLPEQDRIVAKVDELMTLCDRLESAQKERESWRDRLVSASLVRLNQPADALSFREHAQFHLQHVPHLTTGRAHIQQLRQTVLEFAVRGRLAPQLPSDENDAVSLLERLKEDAESYRLEHGLAPPKADPLPDDLPFRAPTGWQWARLSALFRVITDGDHLPPPKSEDGVAFLTISNVTTGRLNFAGCRFVPQSYFDRVAPYRRPSRGDILYTVVGATFGRPAPVDSDRAFCVQRHIAILKPAREANVRFLSLLLASPMIYSQAKRSLTGTAQPTIALRPLRSFLVCVPPLDEQHRIVAKVDELMAICDRLEAQLGVAETERRRLLESVLHRALAPAV